MADQTGEAIHEPIFDIVCVDGFKWTDMLDDLCIPHYTNGHNFDTNRVISFRFVDGIDPDDHIQPYMVIWSGRPEPTLDEIKAEFTKFFPPDEEDEEEDKDDAD